MGDAEKNGDLASAKWATILAAALNKHAGAERYQRRQRQVHRGTAQT
jgi:hypothetical protein